VCQGSAADITKKAMIDIAAFLSSGGYTTRMILQLHDELLFEVPEGELDQMKVCRTEKFYTYHFFSIFSSSPSSLSLFLPSSFLLPPSPIAYRTHFL
jgi:hypothetical protein